MTIGSGIGLIVLGAILTFGIEDAVPGVNLYVIGLILMAAGAIGLVIGLIMQAQRRRPRNVSRTEIVEQNQTPTGSETVRRTDDRAV